MFRKSKKQKTGSAGTALKVEDIFSDALGHNLKSITGRQAAVDIRRLPPRGLETLSALDQAGIFHNTLSTSTEYTLSFFIPEASFTNLMAVFIRTRGEAAAPARLCHRLDGHLSRLFYLEPAGDEVSGSRWQAVPFLAFPKSYDPAEKDETLWRFAGSTVFRAAAEGHELYVLVDSRRLGEVEKLFAADGSFRRAVKDQVMPGSAGGESAFLDRETGLGINIEQNSEFLLGRFFIPLRPGVDGSAGRTRYRSLVAAYRPDADIGADYTRFALSFNFKDKVFEWYYSFHFTGIDEDRPRLKSIISGAMKFLKSAMNIHGVRGHFLNPDIYPDLSDRLCLEAQIFAGPHSGTCRVYIDTEFLTTLAALLLPSWEIDYLKNSLFVRILSAISLNQTLFRKNIHSFYREKSSRPTGDGVSPVIRVSELLNLLPAEDYRRIIQNFFLARGWSVGSLQCLFFFEHTTGEDTPPKIFVDSAFDQARFLSVLPVPKRDEWNRSLAASSSRQEMSEHNLRAMMALYDALEEDRLDLSFRTRFLLKNEFQHRIEEDSTAAITELAGNRLYIDQLSELPPSEAQGVLSRFPLETLALALLPDQSDRVILDRFISRKKQAYLDEEIDFRMGGYEQGTIKPREVLQAMHDLRETVARQFEAWRKEQEKEN